ncbi:hypothetical protein T05_7462 [Trichinella murrelli]|uniref:Uncharacterized protein n=1 Tax=Trichinella murrelli TaxID=144512 RepID=A0A0V0STV7_9BILA|nr:hypothetical protein T05_7462 [Trichinella murrelli]
MSVTGILQSNNCTPKCLSLLKSCTRLFQHDIGKLLFYYVIVPPIAPTYTDAPILCH